jgi:hypothetical protein
MTYKNKNRIHSVPGMRQRDRFLGAGMDENKGEVVNQFDADAHACPPPPAGLPVDINLIRKLSC